MPTTSRVGLSHLSDSRCIIINAWCTDIWHMDILVIVQQNCEYITLTFFVCNTMLLLSTDNLVLNQGSCYIKEVMHCKSSEKALLMQCCRPMAHGSCQSMLALRRWSCTACMHQNIENKLFHKVKRIPALQGCEAFLTNWQCTPNGPVLCLFIKWKSSQVLFVLTGDWLHCTAAWSCGDKSSVSHDVIWTEQRSSVVQCYSVQWCVCCAVFVTDLLMVMQQQPIWDWQNDSGRCSICWTARQRPDSCIAIVCDGQNWPISWRLSRQRKMEQHWRAHN